MDNQLMRYAEGQQIAPYRDRSVARKAKKVYDEVRLEGLKADGSLALAAKIMDGYVMLDAHRQELAQGDQGLSAMLLDIQLAALRHVKEIQANLYDGWNL